ncbi:hypothetical protein J7M22_09640 [Candidatus Poribacteria bacterium]|nr:hypothetical protein [Candidatus Poribacteria bacterium]
MRKLLLCSLMALFAMFIVAQGALAVKIITKGSIPKWLVAAVPNTGEALDALEKDWIKENIGKTEADLSKPENGPEAGDKLTGDAKFDWKVVDNDPSNNYILDFQRDDVFGANDNITAYMYLYIESDKDRTVDLYLGSDDAVAAWVNGEQVWKNPVLRGAGVDQDKVEGVKLKAGKNGLLVKVCEQGGGWAGYARIDPIEGLKISTSKNGPFEEIPAAVSIYFTQFLNLIGPSPGGAEGAEGKDLISEWTNGKFTEEMVAKGIGVARGVKMGEEAWTEGEFTDFGGDNLQVLSEEVFGRQGDQNDITWYGYTVIISPDDRDVKMRFGSDDAIKVWVNGEVVLDNPVLRGSSGFQDTADVHLKKGPNTLLVKVCEQGGGWAGFVGFDNMDFYKGLVVDSSVTPVNPMDKLPTTWGKIKK